MALTRRCWLGVAALGAAAQARADTQPDFASIERAQGGRLGVAAMETGSARAFGYRHDERFPMCSTHKVFTAAAILTAVDQRRTTLDDRVSYGETDLLDYAPITRANVAVGSMTIGALCAAAVGWSDNTAGNLLLDQIGGPPGWTRYIRSIGDDVSRLDRTEPTLNEALASDKRDTTTPRAMLADLNRVLLGPSLSRSSRQQLLDWMTDSPVTGPLIKAGVPTSWRVADKSAAGEKATRNDIGLLMRPSGAPILVSIFYTGSMLDMAGQNSVIARVAGAIASGLGV